MDNITLAIVTDDMFYGTALARSLQRSRRCFIASLHDTESFLRKWKDRGWSFREEYDLILWDGDEIAQVYGGNLVWLSEHAGAGLQERSGPGPLTDHGAGPDHDGPSADSRRFRIGKYQTASALAAQILEIYGTLAGRAGTGGVGVNGGVNGSSGAKARAGANGAFSADVGAGGADVDVVAFASWQGGAGCTTVSMSAGQELIRFYGRRVLWLTLDPVEATTEFMDRPEGIAGVGEFLYRLLRKGEMPVMEKYLLQDGYGLEALAPSAGRNPLAALNREEMGRVLDALAGCGRWDVLLVDVGSCCGEAALAVLSRGDRICCLFRREEGDRARRYRSWLDSEFGGGERAGLILLQNGGEEPEEEPESDGGRSRRRGSRIAGYFGKGNRPGGARAGVETRGKASRPGGTAGGAGEDGPAGTGRASDRRRGEDGPAGAARPGTTTFDDCRRLRLAERETTSSEILLEGRFGQDIHALTEELW